MPRRRRGGVMTARAIDTEVRTSPMPHHLTPDELARELGTDRRDVIAKCLASGVPIFHGRIDRTLFEHALHERGSRQPAVPAGA